MRKRLTLEIALVLAAVAVGIALSTKPWQIYREQRAIADKNLANMRAAESSRTQLTKEKAHLDSGPGQEVQAREMGFHRPGEQPTGETP